MPKVSVIIPCYNASATIRETLDSLRCQTFRTFEVIVVNDGSTDDTGTILGIYTKQFNEKLKIITQINKGQAVAKNVGIEHSSGEFIAFLDSDDLWAPDKLEKQYDYMQLNPGIAMSYTEAYKIDEKGECINTISANPAFRGKCFENLVLHNNIVASSVMVRRDVLDKVGFFDTELAACENWDLWISISRYYPINFIEHPLTFYRVHKDNMSKNWTKMYRARLQVIDKHLSLRSNEPATFELRKKALFFLHRNFAKLHIENLDLKKARRELIDAIKARPNDITCYLSYLKTLLGEKMFRLIRQLKQSRFN